ncbi:MAG: tetraacyldisaccharide 4'-kinase [Mariprofundaceae bacterium]
MKNAVQDWFESMWWRDAPPPFWLLPASRIYARLRRHDQAKRLARARPAAVPLISIGNITIGGSGKTPFVIWLVSSLIEGGQKPVVLCRGDGGSVKHARALSARETAASAGDEAMLLFESCACPVVAGRDRVKGAGIAASLGDIIVLDDGMQYRQLQRDCEVVLIPAAGIGNGYEIPAGPLREPLPALDRADVIVRTGDGPAQTLGHGREWPWQTISGGLEQISGAASAQPARLLAMSAIARPERFIQSLKNEGHEVASQLRFPDHHAYSANDVRKALASGLDVAVTSKDAVKLRSLWPRERPLWLLRQTGEDTPGLLDAILAPILRSKGLDGADHAG